MTIFILFATLTILLIIGVPVAFALVGASAAAVASLGLPMILSVVEIASGANSSTLLAIPLFVFTGEIMLHGGISARIIAFASALVGHMRGGLGQVNVVASTLFGGVSGSAIADVSAIGGTMIPQMVQRGFDRDFAVNVAITSALVALLVPPSHNLILYSAAAGGGISIADLFAAGMIPAALLMLAVMATTWVVARKRGYAAEPFPGMQQVFLRLVSALPGLLLIGLILSGIRAGIFTAVESAAIAVVYALILAVFVYRELSWRGFVALCANAAQTTGAILFVIAASGAFGWMLAYLEVPVATVALLQSIAHEPYTILLLIVLSLLILGTFMDMAPMIIICTPIFLPVAKAYGIDPIHFGIILILTAGIGLITPPVGSVLFVGVAIGKISVGEAVRTIWPFYLATSVVVLLVVFFPALSLWLPAALR
jgi:tripartite ATP-independent transporter DctM subunit